MRDNFLPSIFVCGCCGAVNIRHVNFCAQICPKCKGKSVFFTSYCFGCTSRVECLSVPHIKPFDLGAGDPYRDPRWDVIEQEILDETLRQRSGD